MWLAIFISVINAANGLSHWTRWSQLGSCSVTCGAGAIWQKRTCIGETPNPVCPGAQQRTSRCQKLACPEQECNCGCKLTGNTGSIRSVSPSTKSLECTWNIVTKRGSKIKLTINNFILKYGNLRIEGPNKVYRLLNKRKDLLEPVPFTIETEGNQLNVSLYYHKVIPTHDGVKLDATYETLDIPGGKGRDDEEEDSSLNVPTVAGISACVFIIIVVTCLIVYRKTQRKSKTTNEAEDGVDENVGSCSSASLKHGVDPLWDERDALQKQKQNLPLDRHIPQNLDSDHQALLQNQNMLTTVRMNPTVVPMYINTATLNGQMGFNPQYNQPSYILVPQTSNVIMDQQLHCPPREKPASVSSDVYNACG